jgi:hypothetical protein
MRSLVILDTTLHKGEQYTGSLPIISATIYKEYW